MEKVFKQIDDLSARSVGVVGKSRQEKIKLYSEGLKAKLSQVQYALVRLELFNHRTDDMASTTDKKDASVTQKVNFYCDTFWTFLYSSLDVLSQIINQALKLGLNEKDVKFKGVKDKLQGNNHKALPVAQEYLKCFKSFCFRNLDKYRNCSIHRRQIFTEEITTIRKATPGYSTDAVTTVTRLLCDDPLTVKPKTDKKRNIPEYMIKTKEEVVKYIEVILKATQPVR